jgi:hypothetical protein
MLAKRVTPILNVSNIQESFRWFEKLGWLKAWEWGEPVDFGSVCSGECEIFLCENGQGGRGEDGVWLCFLVEDVDAEHARCLAEGLEIVWPPADRPWNLREMGVRHPDGHVLRIGHVLEEEE